MALASSSYARVAGIQSEVNKVTVTRVAGSEVKNQRQMNLHRKDMEIVVRNICKEQKRLRKAMVKYSRKLHKSRRDRARRELDEMTRDKNSLDNMKKVTDTLNMPDAQVLSIFREDNPNPDDLIPENETKQNTEESLQEENAEGKSEETLGDETSVKAREGSDVTLPPINVTLPTVAEDDGFTDDSNKKDDTTKEDVAPPEIVLNSELETKLRKHLGTLKPKRQGVSYSDIIKLQHSSSPKKLFSLVNILAQKHGVKDKISEQQTTSLIRGRADQSVSPKTSSGLYAIKYGYTVGSRLEPSSSPLKVDRYSLTDGSLEMSQSRQDTQDALSSQRTPETSRRDPALMKSPRSFFLPPIQKHPLEESFVFRKRTEKRAPITWTEAIALIKTVHSL